MGRQMSGILELATEEPMAKGDGPALRDLFARTGRLDRIQINGRFTGARIRAEDLLAVRRCVLHAMGMQSWRQVEESRGAGGS